MAVLREARQTDFAFQVGDSAIDELLVVAFHGSEEMSHLYEIEVELACEDANFDVNAAVGQPAVLSVSGEEGQRYIHGICRRFEQAGEGTRFTSYFATIVPTVWLLTHQHKCRIFQEKSTPDIINEVLKNNGIPTDQFRFALVSDYKPRDYCVQYRETDWAFICRLMEEEGIFFFFEHSPDKHVLVMGDSPTAHAPIPEGPNVTFRRPEGLLPAEEHLHQLHYASQVCTGAVKLKDFYFKKPKMNLTQTQAGGNGSSEFYDYPGEYKDPGLGGRLARVRLEELQSAKTMINCVGTVRRLLPGYRFTLDQHPRQDFNGEYLIIKVVHQAQQAATMMEEGAAVAQEGPTYSVRIEAIPSTISYRPLRSTTKPLIAGSQTAIVVGPQGEEIYTDEYGRVKVQFHWDLQGKYDEESSCWVRVSQGWAGGQYGILFLPRVGQEVIVSFLEGDPDQPMVSGRTYNADNMPPYPLPDEKTKSVIKTNSSKGGGGTNEIRFEDKKDNEQILFYAQKDLHVRVLNDRVENICNNKHLTVDKNSTDLVKENRHITIKKNKHEDIGGDTHLKVGQKLNEEIGADLSTTVKGKRSESVTGSHSETISGSVVEKYGADHKNETTMTSSVKALAIKLEASVGIELKCGGSSIVLTPAAIFIMGGPLVNINSGSGPPVSPVMAQATSPESPKGPESPIDADTVQAGKDTTYTGGEPLATGVAPTEIEGWEPSADDEEPEERSWVEIELVNELGEPVPGEFYRVTAPDGTVREGTTDVNGRAREAGLDPGNCEVSFPNLDTQAWNKLS